MHPGREVEVEGAGAGEDVELHNYSIALSDVPSITFESAFYTCTCFVRVDIHASYYCVLGFTGEAALLLNG